ncbi:hypothetical protein BgiBS90_015020 [Biomphalaria glabrata]|nr:hypothetical protein BgiBS90_015020 [Biomphalaria glabrata]
MAVIWVLDGNNDFGATRLLLGQPNQRGCLLVRPSTCTMASLVSYKMKQLSAPFQFLYTYSVLECGLIRILHDSLISDFHGNLSNVKDAKVELECCQLKENQNEAKNFQSCELHIEELKENSFRKC